MLNKPLFSTPAPKPYVLPVIMPFHIVKVPAPMLTPWPLSPSLWVILPAASPVWQSVMVRLPLAILMTLSPLGPVMVWPLRQMWGK